MEFKLHLGLIETVIRRHSDAYLSDCRSGGISDSSHRINILDQLYVLEEGMIIEVTENNINYDYITEYIRNILPKTEGLLYEMEMYAQENNVPIVQPEVAKLISVITKIIKPDRILEIGTAIGYSAILLSESLKTGGKIVTIERDGNMIGIARKNIKKAGLEDTIKIIEGEAAEVLPNITDKYDCIFIDAAKGSYPDFLSYCIELLNSGGVLIADNVLYKGMIASDKLVKRRKKTIVKRMRSYLETISDNREFESTIIPIGDGVSISYKK
jgi:predicted O-methyltransferase YrrM